MGILCVFCVYDTIGNRCFEKTSFPIKSQPTLSDVLAISLNYLFRIKEKELNKINVFSCSAEHVYPM